MATQSARDSRATADPTTPRRHLTALLDQVADHYATRSSAATELPSREHGRSFEELLKSPFWELELTCTPIHLIPQRNSQGASSHRSTVNPRSLFTEENRKRKPPETQDTSSQARAKPAFVRRVSLIPPPQEDPGVWWWATRPPSHEDPPRGLFEALPSACQRPVTTR